MCQPLLLEDMDKDLDRGEFEEAKVEPGSKERGIGAEDSIMEFTPKAVVTKDQEDTASPLRPPTKTSQHFQGPPSPPQTISRSSKSPQSVSQIICSSSDAVMEHLEDSTA